jgi:chromosome segregation ATPase
MEVKLALRENEVELRKLESHFKGTKDERNSLIADHADNLARKTQLELLIKDLSEDVDRERSGKVYIVHMYIFQ